MRRTFTLASVVSLLLCVAMVVLWVRSDWVNDWLFWDKHAWLCESVGGMVYISHGSLGKRSPNGGFSHEREIYAAQAEPISFAIRGHWESPSRFWVQFHYIDLVILLALLPAVKSILLWRRQRQRRDECRTCSYSLTGNTSGTCPECGTAIPQASRPTLPKP